VNIAVTINVGADGTLFWNFGDGAFGGLGSSPESLLEELVRGIARTFPYVQAD